MPDWIVKLDMVLTRRKRLHHIYAPDGTYKASQQRSGAVLDWLYDNGQTRFVVVTEARTYLCEVQVIDHAPPTEER